MPRQKTKDTADTCHQDVQTDKCSHDSSQSNKDTEPSILFDRVQCISQAVDKMLPLMERMCTLLEQHNRGTERNVPCSAPPVTSRLWQWDQVFNYPVDYVHPALDELYSNQSDNVDPAGNGVHAGSDALSGAFHQESAKQIPTHEFLEELVNSSMTDDSYVEQTADVCPAKQGTNHNDL